MKERHASIDLSPIYELRKSFTVIGLTGRTGSGCTTIAYQLAKGFCSDYPSWEDLQLNHNTHRKYRIIYNYAKENFDPFKVIEYKYVLFLFILSFPLKRLIGFLRSSQLNESFEETGFSKNIDFESEIEEIKKHEQFFTAFHEKISSLKLGEDGKDETNLGALYQIFFDDLDFTSLCETLTRIIGDSSPLKRAKFFQIIANNLRISGDPYKSHLRRPLVRVFTIVTLINLLIKSYRNHCRLTNSATHIVIDSLRNPLEIMFFKQRYAAFYMVAVNRDQEERIEALKIKYEKDFMEMKKIFKEEYDKAKQHEFYKQNVADCIQKADIHISVISEKKIKDFNNRLAIEKENGEKVDNTTPKFTWQMQLLKYVALIFQPGIVPPSPEERCMQIAYAAKCNSGCISRQVGAVVTDEFYSVKAIGWNNTPGGQVPCSLRNVDDLLNKKTGFDYNAFTPFEKNELRDEESNKFQKAIKDHYSEVSEESKRNLKGRNVCFCFKSLKNSCSEGKNQVHTRSLHAEEHAFLQITKFGGQGVKGGKLFTTASPCELCSKKAYQLGIKVIYYVDPYPGISQKQILEGGSKNRNPEVRLFNGAIGNAYHWLYEPFISQKDEQSLIIGHSIKDFATIQNDKLKKAKEDLREKENTILKLEKEIELLKQKKLLD